MAGLIGQYQQGAYTTPVNGSTADATEVLANDNNTRVKHNSHDNDATIHVQSSTLAARAVAGTAQRFWVTTDGLRAYIDDGASWDELAYLPLAGGTVTGNVAISGTFNVNNVAGVITTGGITAAAQIKTTFATGAAQLRLEYDASNHLQVTVASNGATTYNATGGSASHIFSDAVSGTTFTATNFNSVTANISTVGIVRLANNESIGWRNQANSADITLSVTTGNVFNLSASLGVTGGVSVSSASTFLFSSRSAISSSADGVVTLTDNAGTAFSRLTFGGTSSSFPAWRRATTSLEAVLADDSNYTPMRASVGVFGLSATNPADAGNIRLPNNVAVAWRNAANSANHTITLDGSNVFAHSSSISISANVASPSAGFGRDSAAGLLIKGYEGSTTAAVTWEGTFTGSVGSTRYMNLLPTLTPASNSATAVALSPTFSTAANNDSCTIFSTAGTFNNTGAHTGLTGTMLALGAPASSGTWATIRMLHILTPTPGTTKVGIEVENAFRTDWTATAGQTRMLVYDVDNATLERVTVGAADSGGAGFKVLRIAN